MRGLAAIRNAIEPIGTIFNGAAVGTISIVSGALSLGLAPACTGCFLLAAGCFGGANLLRDAKARQQAAKNAKRLKGLSISDPEQFDRLRQLLVENALDPRLLDELKDADENGDPPALAVILTLFQASQNNQLEGLFQQNHALHRALAQQIEVHFDRLKTLLDISLDDLKEIKGSLLDIESRLSQIDYNTTLAAERSRTFPPVDLDLLSYDPDQPARNPYLFALRRVPFVGRSNEFNELLEFCNAPGHEKIWWLWYGPGGFGKSRLAHELCLYLYDRGWCVGRLNLRKRFDRWDEVELIRDTLFIVDYAAENPHKAADAIATLCRRSGSLGQHGCRVRFLLLERSAEGQWWDDFRAGGQSADAEWLLRSAYGESPRELGNLDFDFILEIIDFVLKEKQAPPPTDGCALVRLLDNVDPLNRPLYAAILADAIAERGFDDVRHWGQGDLLAHVLDVELRHWAHHGVDGPHVNALVLATLIGDLRLTGDDLPKIITKAQGTGLLPNPKQRSWAHSPPLQARSA